MQQGGEQTRCPVVYKSIRLAEKNDGRDPRRFWMRITTIVEVHHFLSEAPQFGSLRHDLLNPKKKFHREAKTAAPDDQILWPRYTMRIVNKNDPFFRRFWVKESRLISETISDKKCYLYYRSTRLVSVKERRYFQENKTAEKCQFCRSTAPSKTCSILGYACLVGQKGLNEWCDPMDFRSPSTLLLCEAQIE